MGNPLSGPPPPSVKAFPPAETRSTAAAHAKPRTRLPARLGFLPPAIKGRNFLLLPALLPGRSFAPWLGAVLPSETPAPASARRAGLAFRKGLVPDLRPALRSSAGRLGKAVRKNFFAKPACPAPAFSQGLSACRTRSPAAPSRQAPHRPRARMRGTKLLPLRQERLGL